MTPPRISVDATPNKGHRAREIEATETRWHRDMPAYQALRRQGLQPRSVDGSAVLARDAHDPIEVELGHRVEKKDLQKVYETKQSLAESEREGEFASEMGAALRGEK